MEENYSASKKYFPNLDGLRFIGSLIIIIFHIEDIKSRHGRETIPFIRSYQSMGNFDVSLFFVLSGFLITYLLLKEKKESGTIHLKAYYARRTLRIWPLYYLIVILGYFVLPHLSYFYNDSSNIYKHFWMYVIGCSLFLPSFVRSASGLPETIGPIWSIGVEEVFYLCWPLFLRKTRKYLLLFIVIIAGVLLIRNVYFLWGDASDCNDVMGLAYKAIGSIINEYRISCMAIGAMGAYLVVFGKNKILSVLYRKDIQSAVYIITFTLLAFKLGSKPMQETGDLRFFHEVYSLLFVIIIINLATNPRSILRLDYRWMTYLGKVSYGLYLYHPIMRIISLQLTENLFKREVSGWQMNVVLYASTIISTIFVSVLSYELFEKHFLKLKKSFV